MKLPLARQKSRRIVKDMLMFIYLLLKPISVMFKTLTTSRFRYQSRNISL